MKVTFDTENPADVEYVKTLLGIVGETSPSIDTADYETFINDSCSYVGRRQHVINFIRQAKSKLSLKSEVQTRSRRVMLKAGTTPVVSVGTSGRVTFRVSSANHPAAHRTAESDNSNGWGAWLNLDADKDVKAAMEIAKQAADSY